MKSFWRFSLLASVLLTCSAAAQAAQYYKWTDANGVVHYDTQPPKGVQAETRQVSASAPTPVAAPTEPAATAEGEPVLSAEEENARRTKEYQKQRCEFARKQLAEVNSRVAPKVVERRGAERKVTFLAERAEEGRKWQGEIGQYCGGG